MNIYRFEIGYGNNIATLCVISESEDKANVSARSQVRWANTKAQHNPYNLLALVQVTKVREGEAFFIV